MKTITQFFKKIIFYLIIPVFAFGTMDVYADNPSDQQTSVNPTIIVPSPPNIDARGYVLMDATSGKILAAKNMNQKMPPASLTKLMTLYVISQALSQNQIKLTDQVRVSKDAWQTGGSRMFLKLGSHIPVKKLVEGIIVASGNDACVAISDYIAGSQATFANLMNQTAQKLGMQNTHYIDATGLPNPNHYSTPYDLAILARHIINDFPQYYAWYKQKWITWNGIRQPNRNRLLWRDSSVDGLKTGHTKDAGFCLIASSKRKGMRLISVVMGTPSDEARSNDSQALLNWGFRFFNTYKLFAANKSLAKLRIWFGEKKYISLGLEKDLYITIPSGEYKNLKATLSLPPKLEAPITQGKPYGTLIVILHGKKVTSVPLIALENNPKGGFWRRIVDHIVRFL